MGAKWRIGNGLRTKIFKDAWLPRSGAGRVLSIVSALSKNATVNQLIDSESGWWNSALIDEIFLPYEAHKIKSIPFCSSPQEDVLIWQFINNDLYPVKFGFNLLCEAQNSEEASSSDIESTKKFWSSLWKLRIPNKVKCFTWRACTESLPTMYNLSKRKVTNNASCIHCKSGKKTSLHALWLCPLVKEVWGSRFALLPSQFYRVHNYAELLHLFFSSNFDIELFAMTSWVIWSRRNKLRVGEMAVSINRVAEEARKQLQEFHRSWPNSKMKVRKTKSMCEPSDSGHIKINFDGVMFEEINAAGIGVVVQNDRGEVLAEMTKRIPILESVVILETMAARRAV